MSLELEPHIFRIVEGQAKMFEFLGAFNWQFDMDAGLLFFLADLDGEEIARCPVQILGSVSELTNSWLWGWANQASQIPANLLQYASGLKEQARKENKPEFLNPMSFPLISDHGGMRLATIAAGFAGMFTYYNAPYEGGSLFLGIESFPQAQAIPRDALMVKKVILTGISAVEFNHRQAIWAYLGEPASEKNQSYIWLIGNSAVQVQLDNQDRVYDITVSPA